MTTQLEDLEHGNVAKLKVKGIIGFDGSTLHGFIVHPDGTHTVYALGNKVIIQNWYTKEQHFLDGHTNIISAVDLSKSGKLIASGQINHLGFKARLVIWDFYQRSSICSYELHKVRIEAIAFSHNDQYCISLGGRDCGSVIVWNIEENHLLCGATIARGIHGDATTLQTMHLRELCFITCGINHLTLWRIDVEARNLRSLDVKTTKIKRTVICTDINLSDKFCYCGTTTGDLIKINLNYHPTDTSLVNPVETPLVVGCYAKITKKKLPPGVVSLYEKGITSIKLLSDQLMLIGAGDGTVELVEEVAPKEPKGSPVKIPSIPALKTLRSTNIISMVTSLQLFKNNQQDCILAGTENCEIFSINLADFSTDLIVTCHTSAIYDLAFPYDFSEVFATAGKDDVRIWSLQTQQELLRIRVQNFSCSSLCFTYDGKSIVTGWNDGIIRAFTPLTGRLMYVINNAHNKGVTAIAITRQGDLLVSGGVEGQVRLWRISPYNQELLCVLKEHKAPISSIDLNHTHDEAVSSCTDGSCVIWDLVRQCRRQILFSNTLFTCARYYPNSVQILTCGSDRKLSYWETLDASLVREIEDPGSNGINTLDISIDGLKFITGGNDQIIKLWRYNEGIITHIGIGHSSVISSVRYSPNQKYIITTSASGSIFIWKAPTEGQEETEEDDKVIKKPPSCKKKTAKEENIKDLPSSRSDKCKRDCNQKKRR